MRMDWDEARRNLVAELFGTFTLVFAGAGAITINDVSGGTVSHVGIALTSSGGGVQKKKNGGKLDGRTWDEMPAGLAASR